MLYLANVNYSKFVLHASARTGSTMFRHMLRAHPNIKMYPEEFSPQNFPPNYDTKFGIHPKEEADSYLHMDRIYSLKGKLDMTYLQGVGFSFLYHHLKQFPQFYEYLISHKIKVIHLTRHNMLDVILSLKLVKEHGDVWGGVIYTNPVFISYGELLGRFKKLEDTIENTRQVLKSKNISFIETHYDVLKSEETHRKLLDFLGVDYAKLVPNTLKQRVKSQSEMITNYSDLKVKFRTTKYYKFFED